MCIAITRYCAEIQNGDFIFVENRMIKHENNLSIYQCWDQVYFIFKIPQELNFAFLHNFIYFNKNLRERKLEKLQRKL